MIAVPANAAADVQQNFLQRGEDGGDFVGHRFGGMKMAGVQAKELLISDGIAVIELMRADDIAFGAEAKELSFDRIEIMPRIELLRENGIKRLLQPLAGCLAVHWDILVAVRNPNVRDARRAECFAH